MEGALTYELLIDSIIGFLDGLEKEEMPIFRHIDKTLAYPVCEVFRIIYHCVNIMRCLVQQLQLFVVSKDSTIFCIMHVR